MWKWIILCIMFIDQANCDIVNNKLVYNDNNRVTFFPPNTAKYFGYSVFLTAQKLIVGAPKANSTEYPYVKSGRVFTCSVKETSMYVIICNQLTVHDRGRFDTKKFLTKDMLFGATVGAINDNIIFACAPSWAESYKDTHLLTIGACYAFTSTRRDQKLFPLKDNYAISAPGNRKEYLDYGGKYLNFYAYGLAGLSMKVTDDSNILLGAPGILQNTGGIIDYFILERGPTIRKQPVANPYFTYDLGPDDYFGYSVESAMFEPHGIFLQVGGAPRSKMGLGQVLIIEPVKIESDPLKIKAKIVGPQMGSYFGAALCCVDINSDGRIDLLVGAPNYVKRDSGFKYDQGAVIVYLNREKNSTFVLEESTYVYGSEASRARFGSSIASLGDIDGDGFNDVAIGAPWEDNGVVYIYQGSKAGIKRDYLQRITAERASGFGISISTGKDVDNDLCNDVAIGAHASGKAYLYKCTPTIKVDVLIKLPDIADLPENANNFTTYFCLNVRPQYYSHVKLKLQAIKMIDADLRRASILEDTTNEVTLSPGIEMCDEHVVIVNTTTDLTKPIPISYELKLVTPQDSARLADDSVLQASSLFQMIYDCGKDMICTPLLKLTLEPFDSPYIPGTNQKLGAKVTIVNHEEPSYGIKLYLTLPLVPKRVPTSCTLQDFNMTCYLPALFRRNDTAEFDIELEYEYSGNYTDLVLTAEMVFADNVTVKELVLEVRPVANITVSGKALPNVTVEVSRDALYGEANITFLHYYQISNLGPSDWYNLKAVVHIPDKINLSSPVMGCVGSMDQLDCEWTIAAKHTISVVLPLRLDLLVYGNFLKENTTYNATSKIHILSFEKYTAVRTILVLDPAPPLWPWIVAVVAGILLLAIIMLVLYKFGFFTRPKKEDLKRLIEDKNTQQEPSSSEHSCPTVDEGNSASTAAICETRSDFDQSTLFDVSTLEYDTTTTQDDNDTSTLDTCSRELIELDSD